jgi:hypothetical protein
MKYFREMGELDLCYKKGSYPIIFSANIPYSNEDKEFFLWPYDDIRTASPLPSSYYEALSLVYVNISNITIKEIIINGNSNNQATLNFYMGYEDPLIIVSKEPMYIIDVPPFSEEIRIEGNLGIRKDTYLLVSVTGFKETPIKIILEKELLS